MSRLVRSKSEKNIFQYKKSGFTLIELLVVIALIAVVVGFAIGGISGIVPNFKVKSNVRELMADLNSAKLAAIKNKGEALIVLTYTGGGNKGGVSACFDNNSDSLCLASDDQMIFSFEVDSKASLKLENIDFADNKFKFNSRGIPDLANPSSLKISNDSGYEISLEISPVGRIKIN